MDNLIFLNFEKVLQHTNTRRRLSEQEAFFALSRFILAFFIEKLTLFILFCKNHLIFF